MDIEKLEFSRIEDTKRLNDRQVSYEATPDECEALAERLEAANIKEVRGIADYTTHPQGIMMDGHITAQVTQTCVATLKPITQNIDSTFQVLLIPNTPPLKETDIDDNDYDTECFLGTQVDVGELFAQYLCLAVPLHPRLDSEKPVMYVEDKGKANPFETLRH